MDTNFARTASQISSRRYGVATISRLLKIIGLFCKRALIKRRYSAKGRFRRYHVAGMRWLRLVGSLKLQASFAEYRLFYIALLQGRHCRYHVADMAWLRLVGSFKLQVSFAKEPCKRDDILQKNGIVDIMSQIWDGYD